MINISEWKVYSIFLTLVSLLVSFLYFPSVISTIGFYVMIGSAWFTIHQFIPASIRSIKMVNLFIFVSLLLFIPTSL